ncbi:MAG: hypothetical protein LBK57_06970 [Clostridiales Family XIII bacterium]|jgi:hypothetical protein|nr:hypothetical protein [Clostridiales Family XIII bacterium]
MKNTARELTAFKNQIFFHGVIVALIFEAGSLLFLGFDTGFAYGLALGTAVSAVNFSILVFVSKRLLNGGRTWMGFAGYLVRLIVYGFAFFMALRVSNASAVGAALGFITLKIAVYYIHGFKGLRSALSKKRTGAEPLKWKKRRKKGIMKDIFGSPYDEEDEEDEPDED